MARQVYNNFFIGNDSELTGTTMNAGCVFFAEDAQRVYGVDISGDTFVISGNFQKEIFSGYTLTSGDTNYTLWLSASTGTTGTTITVDDTLPDNFECHFYNDGPQTWDFSGGTGTLSIPDGNNLVQDKVCTIFKKLSNNDYRLKGELE